MALSKRLKAIMDPEEVSESKAERKRELKNPKLEAKEKKVNKKK